jgi:hypothetical protein
LKCVNLTAQRRHWVRRWRLPQNCHPERRFIPQPLPEFKSAGIIRHSVFTAAEDRRTPCADETMKPTSESLSPAEARYSRVAEGNCVAARRGGEHSEAKARSQTKVKSIRPLQRASWRRNRICRGRLRGVLAKPGPLVRPMSGASRVNAGTLALWGDWNGNVRRCHGLSQDRCRRAEETADDRVPVVALKRVTTVERRGIGR